MSRPWWPRTSPPAASTLTTSGSSCTPTRPSSTRHRHRSGCTAAQVLQHGGHPHDGRAGGRRPRPDPQGRDQAHHHPADPPPLLREVAPGERLFPGGVLVEAGTRPASASPGARGELELPARGRGTRGAGRGAARPGRTRQAGTAQAAARRDRRPRGRSSGGTGAADGRAQSGGPASRGTGGRSTASSGQGGRRPAGTGPRAVRAAARAGTGLRNGVLDLHPGRRRSGLLVPLPSRIQPGALTPDLPGYSPNVHVLIAPDCFTGTLTATQAAEAMAEAGGARRRTTSTLMPLSDGGPGFLDVLATSGPTARRCWPPRPTRSAARCPERCCSRTATGAARHTSNRPRPPACTCSPPTSATRPSPARGRRPAARRRSARGGRARDRRPRWQWHQRRRGWMLASLAGSAHDLARGVLRWRTCPTTPSRGSTTCASVSRTSSCSWPPTSTAARAPGRLRGLRPAEGRLARTRPGPRGGARAVHRGRPALLPPRRDLLTGAARRLDRHRGRGGGPTAA